MKHKNIHFFLLLVLSGFLFENCKKLSDIPTPQGNKSLTFFEFRKIHNPTLIQDISCEIRNDTIYATTFSGTNITALKPYFTDGIEVFVSGKSQESGKTIQNFNAPITYTVESNDGTIRRFVVKFSDTKLPTLYISTNNQAINSKTAYISGYMKIKGKIVGDSLFGGKIEIRGRGNSTWSLPKKPYKIKLDKKASLIGMNESKQWVLLANYADKSLIRNELGFELSRRLGLVYTPASRFVEVILNGAYIGNYQLVEQIDVGKNKINIAEQSVPTNDISGGYLVELDGFANRESVFFSTPRNMMLSVHYPESEDMSQTQKDYIKNHIATFENNLFKSDSTELYKKYFDIDSYINFYLVNEIIGNSDIFWSTYLYKNAKSDIIFTSPVWDFDISANNDSRIGDTVNKLMLDVAHNPKLWINALMKDKIFRNKIRQRWNEIKADKLEISTFIDDLALKLSASQKLNFEKWKILNERIYLNLQVNGSFPNEINYLKTYLKNRINYLNIQFNSNRFD